MSFVYNIYCEKLRFGILMKTEKNCKVIFILQFFPWIYVLFFNVFQPVIKIKIRSSFFFLELYLQILKKSSKWNVKIQNILMVEIGGS